MGVTLVTFHKYHCDICDICEICIIIDMCYHALVIKCVIGGQSVTYFNIVWALEGVGKENPLSFFCEGVAGGGQKMIPRPSGFGESFSGRPKAP
jgi:hypothetical protein